jgi:hypothetical protein
MFRLLKVPLFGSADSRQYAYRRSAISPLSGIVEQIILLSVTNAPNDSRERRLAKGSPSTCGALFNLEGEAACHAVALAKADAEPWKIIFVVFVFLVAN